MSCPLRKSDPDAVTIFGNKQDAGDLESCSDSQQVVVGRGAAALLEITDGGEAKMSCFGELFLRPLDQGSCCT